jgi:hypothetical protein
MTISRLNQGFENSGLVLINTTSFSAVSSVNLPANIFTSAFNHYRLMINFGYSGAGTTRLRFRSGTSDNTGTHIFHGNIIQTSLVNTANEGSANSAFIHTNGFNSQGFIYIFNRAGGSPKLFASGLGGARDYWFSAGSMPTGTNDSINFFRSAGTMNGTVQVYGMKD